VGYTVFMNIDFTKGIQPLVTGFLSQDDITISVKESNLVLPKKIEQEIQDRWSTKKKEAEEKDLHLFNGTSYRLNTYSYQNNVLNLELSIFDYKHRYGLVLMTRENVIDQSLYRHNGLFVGSTVKTADNRYVMVKLSGKSTNPNKYDVLGGMAETDVECTSGKYIFDVLYKEFEEEAGIAREEVSKCDLRTIYIAQNGHIGFYFETELAVTSRDLQKRFEGNTDIDIDSLCFYEKEEYLDILRNQNDSKRMMADFIEGIIE